MRVDEEPSVIGVTAPTQIALLEISVNLATQVCINLKYLAVVVRRLVAEFTRPLSGFSVRGNSPVRQVVKATQMSTPIAFVTVGGW